MLAGRSTNLSASAVLSRVHKASEDIVSERLRGIEAEVPCKKSRGKPELSANAVLSRVQNFLEN